MNGNKICPTKAQLKIKIPYEISCEPLLLCDGIRDLPNPTQAQRPSPVLSHRLVPILHLGGIRLWITETCTAQLFHLHRFFFLFCWRQDRTNHYTAGPTSSH